MEESKIQEHFGEVETTKGYNGYTYSFDGKTICSAGAMERYESPVHIISAHVAELGITLGQQTVAGKSNEIPTLRELLDMLELGGCMVAADALHCQRETAKAIVSKQADYLLSVKDNQPTLKENIVDYVQDDTLRKTMDTAVTVEKNSGRIERRSAYSICDVECLQGKQDWANLACVASTCIDGLSVYSIMIPIMAKVVVSP